MNQLIIREKSSESLKSAALCLRNDLFNVCVSRSYYAVVQITLCYILAHRVLPEGLSHSKIHNIFGQLATRALRDRLISLYANRQDADYRDIRFGKKLAIEIYTEAADIFNDINTRIAS